MLSCFAADKWVLTWKRKGKRKCHWFQSYVLLKESFRSFNPNVPSNFHPNKKHCLNIFSSRVVNCRQRQLIALVLTCYHDRKLCYHTFSSGTTMIFAYCVAVKWSNVPHVANQFKRKCSFFLKIYAVNKHYSEVELFVSQRCFRLACLIAVSTLSKHLIM